MEIVGRITANAEIKTLNEGDRRVVNFSVAVNDRYKPKGAKELVEVTTFYNCSYWLTPNIAPYLLKGVLLQLQGHLSVRAWIDGNGAARAALHLHVASIKLLSKASPREGKTVLHAKSDVTEDLPF